MIHNFKQKRHQPGSYTSNSSLVVACSPMKSNVNISMIARTASCLGACELILTGNNRVDRLIARDCDILIKSRRSLSPVITKYKADGYKVIGLEQATNSCNIYDYEFSDEPTLLIVGNERTGISQDVLNRLDEVIEIPLFGKPYSLNAGVATSLCLFEYAKQMNRKVEA